MIPSGITNPTPATPLCSCSLQVQPPAFTQILQLCWHSTAFVLPQEQVLVSTGFSHHSPVSLGGLRSTRALMGVINPPKSHIIITGPLSARNRFLCFSHVPGSCDRNPSNTSSSNSSSTPWAGRAEPCPVSKPQIPVICQDLPAAMRLFPQSWELRVDLVQEEVQEEGQVLDSRGWQVCELLCDQAWAQL